MKPPFFSIIIPTFNAEKTICESLNAICGQTFIDYEIIIVDGDSKDKTVEIIQGYQTNLRHIKIISEPDNGVYDAMNKGIRLATGNWIYFLGSDDKLFDASTLGSMALHLKSTDAEVVYGNVFSTRFSGIYAGELTEKDILQKNICHQAIFFKQSVFEKTGLFDLRYKAHADWDHNFKWFLSDKIKHKFVEVTIADYADGGLSSRSGDPVFAKIMKWKYFFYRRKEMSLWKKILFVKEELKKTIAENRMQDSKIILMQLPKFILS